jgi:ketosteroid isomerase-like protein
MSSRDNKAIITTIMNELARGNARPFVDAMAENFIWRPMGKSRLGKWRAAYEGKHSVRRELFAPLATQFKGDFTRTTSQIFADGDHVIVELQGAATTHAGEAYNNQYCLVIRMSEGKMVEAREYLDSALADAVLEPIRL